MKIAFVCPWFKPAICGIGQVVYQLSINLVGKGHEVHVFTVNGDKKGNVQKSEEIIDNIYIHRLDKLIKLSKYSTFFPGVYNQLMKYNFDVIHSHAFGHPHVYFANKVAKKKNIPHIHTTHCPWDSPVKGVIARLMTAVAHNSFAKNSLKGASKVIAITEWEREYLHKIKVKDEAITIIPNGTPKEYLAGVKRNNFKKKYNIKNNFILYLGRLHPTKSPDLFVKAAKEFLKERDDIEFVLCGPDEGMQQQVEKSIGDEKRIHLLGRIPKADVVKAYDACTIFTLTSSREGLPLSLFESFSLGKPVVATPVNGIPYILKEGINGFLFPYGDIATLKIKWNFLLNNPELINQIGETNKKLSEKYTWEKIANQTEQIYTDAINTKK